MFSTRTYLWLILTLMVVIVIATLYMQQVDAQGVMEYNSYHIIGTGVIGGYAYVIINFKGTVETVNISRVKIIGDVSNLLDCKLYVHITPSKFKRLEESMYIQ